MSVTERELYYDPYDLEVNNDPYEVFRRLRNEQPLYRNEQHDFWAVSRFDDVEQVLKDHRTYSSAKGNILELIHADMELPPGTVIMEDPPSHTLHRKLMARMFTPRKVAALEPKIRELCAQCLDPLVGSSGFDLIAELGAVMPMQVIGMLIGIPEEDRAAIREASDANLRTEAGQPMEVKADLGNEKFIEYLDWRVEHPSDDIMTMMLNAEFEDEHGITRTLTRDEMVIYLSVVAGAGNETTTKLIGWAGKLLADHPDQRAKLVADPGGIPAAVEELLRYEPASRQIARYVTEDVEWHGETVPAGSAILALVGAANRDERRWDDPERFDVFRPAITNIAFGHGIHFCLGASLARIEARIAIEEILKRFPEWDVDHEGARLAQTSTVRGYDALPIVLP
ncbi:MAG TPA: cytochrome P450 [Acidimicrobiales bacterium]|nr:cytochrome P450 [Acidimicrobiales bacterium]